MQTGQVTAESGSRDSTFPLYVGGGKRFDRLFTAIGTRGAIRKSRFVTEGTGASEVDFLANMRFVVRKRVNSPSYSGFHYITTIDVLLWSNYDLGRYWAGWKYSVCPV